MNMKWKAVAVALLVLSGMTSAQTVDWIAGFGQTRPGSWSITPSSPSTGVVIGFSGPTDLPPGQAYGNTCDAEANFGGDPYLSVNNTTKTIELKFQGPAPVICPLIYMPTVGLNGSFGPLAAGNWVFKCTHVKIPFQINFTVGGGGGGGIIYVDQNGPMTIVPPDGSSWANAFHNLQDGLAAANAGDTVRVADGTYTPDIGSGVTPGDRGASFAIPHNVTVQCGYAGYGAFNPNARNVDLYPTYLSGDLNMNDLWGLLNLSDNSYHVVSSTGPGTLDGAIVVSGNADGPGFDGYGAGVFLDGSDLLIQNCKIKSNKADLGGGVACVNGIAPSLVHTEITGNWAYLWGGALYNDDGNVEITNCLLTGNTAGAANVLGGDAIFNAMGSLDINSSTIADNRPGHGAPANGRAIINFVWGPGFVDTISIKNSIVRNGGQEIWSTEPGIVTLYYNNIEGGSGGYAGTGNIDQNPQFKNPGAFGIEGQWYFDDDGYTLQFGSPSIDAGNQAFLPLGLVVDLNGNARVQGGQVDQGAYEGIGLPPAVVLVPNVVGQTQAAAQTTLNNFGLVVGTVTQAYSNSVPAGRVISQNPAGGATANVGAAVNLVISLGPNPTVVVPNVVNLTQGAAQTAISSAGLVVGTITQAYSNTIAAGRVISQSPVGGSTVSIGSSVNLVISLGVDPGPGGSWILLTVFDIHVIVPSSPPSSVPVSGPVSTQVESNFIADYKIEVTAIPAVNGTWSATPSTGIIPSGISNLNFTVNGSNVNLSSLSPGDHKIAEAKLYVKPH